MADRLQELRAKIDQLDLEILRLLNERAGHAHEAGLVKNGAVYRPEREAQVLRRLIESNPGPLQTEHVLGIFREIMSACMALEKPLIIAFLGPSGTFTEAAAHKHWGQAAHTQACSSIDEVFAEVESGRADFGTVPVENSTEGTINKTLDLLLQTPLKICGEVQLRVHQLLMSKHTDIKKITKVYSHMQSLAQCHAWLSLHLPHVERVAVASNAQAAKMAAEEENAAAIAGEKAATVYGLSVLTSNIEDEPNNTTRFLIVGNQEIEPSGKDKTSLVMSAENRPGAVHDLLLPLAEHQVSMTKFESRPARSGLWEYIFFVDIEGHQREARIAQALDALRPKTTFLKILGSYPIAVA